MEYVHGKMGDLKGFPDYNFHNKCEKLQLVDLSFVDDLLSFSREMRSMFRWWWIYSIASQGPQVYMWIQQSVKFIMGDGY